VSGCRCGIGSWGGQRPSLTPYVTGPGARGRGDAHLVDAVLPRVPVRQWVRPAPYRLRYQMAWNHGLSCAVLRVYTRVLLDVYARGAQERGIAGGRTGMVIVASEYASCRLRGRMRASSGATTESKRPDGGKPRNAVDKALRRAGQDAVAVLAEQGPDERSGAVRAEPARLRRRPGIAPVGLHLAGARRIHGREVSGTRRSPPYWRGQTGSIE